MNFSQRTKCAGCKALRKFKDKDGKEMFSCVLGFNVDWEILNGNVMKPKPTEKCFKPLTDEEFTEAKEIVNSK